MKNRILIVEDERRLRQFLAEAMASNACELVWTQTAHEALRRALDEHFDLVLLDVNVTDMDAWHALNWFNALRPLLPVVMLTERPGESKRAEIFGAEAALEKPLDEARVHRTVEQSLNQLRRMRTWRLRDSFRGWLRTSPAQTATAPMVYEENHSAC